MCGQFLAVRASAGSGFRFISVFQQVVPTDFGQPEVLSKLPSLRTRMRRHEWISLPRVTCEERNKL